MSIFRYDQKEVRTHEADGQAWFCLNDVARVLEIAQPKHFLSSDWCDKDGVRSTDLIDALGRSQQTTFINEGNLYTLVSRSRKPGAIAFTRWVNHVVLPALRKTGAYSIQSPPQDSLVAASEMVADMRLQIEALASRILEVERRLLAEPAIEPKLPSRREETWLVGLLASGPKTVKQVRAACRRDQISWHKIRKLQGVATKHKVGFGSNSCWVWSRIKEIGFQSGGKKLAAG